MNYRVRRQGVDLGSFSLDDLRQRREAGEFTGAEYVQEEGLQGWQPLDLVLQTGFRRTPPPVPSAVPSGGLNLPLFWGLLVSGVALAVAAFVFFMVRSGVFQQAIRAANTTSTSALEAASKPVETTAKTQTAEEVSEQFKEFRHRQWYDGYQQHGPHQESWDADASRMIEGWLKKSLADSGDTNFDYLAPLASKLASEGCDDPMVLTAMEQIATNLDGPQLLERALKGFEGAAYQAYPKWFVAVRLASRQGNNLVRQNGLDQTASRWFKIALSDGSFAPEEQPEVA